MYNTKDITGTLVNYYITCPREAWLYSRNIHADQSDDALTMGRILAQIREGDKEPDFPFSNLRFDRIEKQHGHYIVTEHKKTMSNPEAAKMQLLFYIYLLKTGLKLKKIDGKVISGKTVIFVSGDEVAMEKMRYVLSTMSAFLSENKPPLYTQTRWCSGCAYRSYCEG